MSTETEYTGNELKRYYLNGKELKEWTITFKDGKPRWSLIVRYTTKKP